MSSGGAQRGSGTAAAAVACAGCAVGYVLRRVAGRGACCACGSGAMTQRAALCSVSVVAATMVLLAVASQSPHVAAQRSVTSMAAPAWDAAAGAPAPMPMMAPRGGAMKHGGGPQVAYAAAENVVGGGGGGGSSVHDAVTRMIATHPEAAPDAAQEAIILKSGSMTLEVANVTDASRAIEAAARKRGGSVESSAMWDHGPHSATATVVVRVPAAAFEAFCDVLRGLTRAWHGRVLADSAAARDATAEYVDAGARERVARASLAQMEALMAAAATVRDVLDIQREMNAITERIEAAAATRQYLAAAAAMSSLTVSLQTPPEVWTPPPPPPGWSAGRTLVAALAALAAALRGCIDAAIYTFVFALPVAGTALLAALALSCWAPGGLAGAQRTFMTALRAAATTPATSGVPSAAGSGTAHDA